MMPFNLSDFLTHAGARLFGGLTLKTGSLIWRYLLGNPKANIAVNSLPGEGNSVEAWFSEYVEALRAARKE